MFRFVNYCGGFPERQHKNILNTPIPSVVLTLSKDLTLWSSQWVQYKTVWQQLAHKVWKAACSQNSHSYSAASQMPRNDILLLGRTKEQPLNSQHWIFCSHISQPAPKILLERGHKQWTLKIQLKTNVKICYLSVRGNATVSLRLIHLLVVQLKARYPKWKRWCRRLQVFLQRSHFP